METISRRLPITFYFPLATGEMPPNFARFMISWIQKTFQQHFRVVFAILLVIIIVSFVFTIGAAPGLSSPDRGSAKRPFFDRNLASAADQQLIMGDAQLSVLVNYGMPNVDEQQLQQFALSRYTSIALANSLHLPAPSEEELTKHLKSLRPFQGKDGEFDPALYATFRSSLKARRLNEDAVLRVLSDDYRAALVEKLFAGPGYVLGREVRDQLAKAETNWTLAVATIPASSHKVDIKPTDAELEAFYADNKVRYLEQPRFSGSQLTFSASDYLSKVTLRDEDVLAYFKANKANFVKAPAANAAKDAPAPDETAQFTEAKPAVEAALRIERARRMALSAAADLTYDLDRKNANPGTIVQLLAEKGLSLSDVKPFSRADVPAELGAEAASEAFKLDKTRFFTDGLSTPTGATILFFKELLPAREPALQDVRAKVLADYVVSERHKRFADVAKQVREKVLAATKLGQPFEATVQQIAKDAGLSVDLKKPAAFSLRQPSRDLPYSAIGALDNLEKGGLSELIISDNQGVMVYALDKGVPSFDEKAANYVAMHTQIAQVSAGSSGDALITEIKEKELNKGTAGAK